MPPKGERLKAAEVDMLKNGSAACGATPTSRMSDTDVLDAIAIDQLRLRDRSADYRYVSFAHFIGQGRSDKEMEAIRQVFTFILNSLSRRGQIVDLETIDDGRSIYRLRLSDLGWDEALWDTADRLLPLLHQVRTRWRTRALYDQLRTEAPVVRGDWFLATATKAPLYDLLVDPPAHARPAGRAPGHRHQRRHQPPRPGRARQPDPRSASAARAWRCTTACWSGTWATRASRCGSPTTSTAARAGRT